MRDQTRNDDAERALVGSLLWAPQRYDDVARIVKPEHFFERLYKATYLAIGALVKAGKMVEPVAVLDTVRGLCPVLPGNPVPALADAIAFREAIVGELPTAAHAVHYAGIVATTGIRRQLSMVAHDLGNCQDDEQREIFVEQMVDLSKQLSHAEATTRGFTTIQLEAEAYLDSLRDGKDPLISFGLAELDFSVGGGAALGEMVCIAARPSNGKTLLAVQMVEAMAEQGLPCFVVSEEMTARQLGERYVGRVTSLEKSHWQKNAERIKGEVTEHCLRRAPMWIAEPCGTVANAVKQIERAAADGAKVIAVDYAQLLKGKGKDQYERVTDCSVQLKAVAKRCNVLMLFLAQLNRPDKSRKLYQEKGRDYPRGNIPTLTDLKDSGQIEQDADVVFVLQWPLAGEPRYKPHDEFFIYALKCRNRGIHQNLMRLRILPGRQMVVSTNRSDALDKWNEGGDEPWT